MKTLEVPACSNGNQALPLVLSSFGHIKQGKFSWGSGLLGGLAGAFTNAFGLGDVLWEKLHPEEFRKHQEMLKKMQLYTSLTGAGLGAAGGVGFTQLTEKGTEQERRQAFIRNIILGTLLGGATGWLIPYAMYG